MRFVGRPSRLLQPTILNAYPSLSGRRIAMVGTIDELFQVIRANPFIDGVGYFVEVTTREPVPERAIEALTMRMQDDFCAHSQASLEGTNVLGLDFHEHILTQGEDSEHFITALEVLLRHVEREYGVDHLCIEFQFDFTRARQARHELDELLRP